MNDAKWKPILCIDFDGVIHDYKRGWQGGEIYGDVVPGFFAWAAEAQKQFNLVIYSSRSSTEEGRLAIGAWLATQLRSWEGDKLILHIAVDKPPAWVTIDDRCICFQGDWLADELQPDALRKFTPWVIKHE